MTKEEIEKRRAAVNAVIGVLRDQLAADAEAAFKGGSKALGHVFAEADVLLFQATRKMDAAVAAVQPD